MMRARGLSWRGWVPPARRGDTANDAIRREIEMSQVVSRCGYARPNEPGKNLRHSSYAPSRRRRSIA